MRSWVEAERGALSLGGGASGRHPCARSGWLSARRDQQRRALSCPHRNAARRPGPSGQLACGSGAVLLLEPAWKRITSAVCGHVCTSASILPQQRGSAGPEFLELRGPGAFPCMGPPVVPGQAALASWRGVGSRALLSPTAPPSVVARSCFLPWPWHCLCPSCGSEVGTRWFLLLHPWPCGPHVEAAWVPWGEAAALLSRFQGTGLRGVFDALLSTSGPGVAAETLQRCSSALGWGWGCRCCSGLARAWPQWDHLRWTSAPPTLCPRL